MESNPDSSPTADDRTPIRTLHVDDEPGFTDLAAQFLEREDDRIAVETATSASEGLERLAEGTFDCVVSDYDMPGQNGIEFLGTVREDHPDLPFILFTGKGSEEIASEAISAGVTDYLQKGTGTDQYTILANRITNVVEARRSRQALEERKRLLETLISNLPGIFYRCRNERGWPMEFVAGECAELTGYPASALERQEVSWGDDILHPDDREEMWSTVQDAVDAGDSFEVTYRIVTSDGTTKWMWERGRGVYSTDGELEALEGFITDITERKASRTELERTNALLSTLFDALPVGVIAEDADREVMAVNERIFEVLDVPGEPDDVVGEDCAELAAAVKDEFENPQAFVDRIEDLVATETPAEDELTLASDETLERVHRPIELPDGKGHLWTYRDVTERVQRERELERYETLVETVARGVFAQDSDGRYTFVNSHIEDQTGYDRQELIGSRPSAFLPREDVEDIEEGIQEMLAGERETVPFESTITTATGENVPIEGKLALLPSEEGFDGTVGVVRDVTERRERERKLDRLRDRSQVLSYTEAKNETARIAAEAANDIIGAPFSGVHLLDDAEDVLEPTAVVDSVTETFDSVPRYPRGAEPGTRAGIVWGAFESGRALSIDDTDAYDRLVEPTPAKSVILQPIGRHGVFVVSADEPEAFDATDEALVELLATSLRTALDRVEREAKLRRQRDELQQRNERLDQFTSVVSHDLRNPLDVAEGYLTLAREDCESEHLAEVAAAHDRMETLIDDILTLARDGERVSEVVTVDLETFADSCWRNVATENAELAVRTDRSLAADRSQLRRLLENVFRNAVEHGGDTTVVTIGDLEDGFYVEDDGPGIPAEERDSVFETGYSTTADGTGFGLSIVEEISTAHGWDIDVTEGEEGGARFEITGVESGQTGTETGDGLEHPD